jgi:serine/threonine-protein kinase
VQVLDPFGLIGQVLDGQFRVDRYVGEGGFSVVYGGTHIGLNELIAVKCLKLPPALGSALVDSFVQRFRDESRIHYRLPQGHLHIARSIASGTTTAPATSALIPYMVLEWLEGRSLSEEFAERRASGYSGRTLVETVRLLDSAADALAYAHAQGVVHRDFNPGNLFLAKTQSGIKLKVLDFGVAKIMADSAIALGPVARTLGNVRMFTLAYGAPEQFDERVGAVGPWTDVYAMALVVLEALRDRPVMDGASLSELAASALSKIRPTPRALGLSLGAPVEELLGKAVALSPDARPQDAGEFWGMLKNAMSRSEVAPTRVETSRLSSPLPPAGPAGPGGTLVLASSGGGTRGTVEGLRPKADSSGPSPMAASIVLPHREASDPPPWAARPAATGGEFVAGPVVRPGLRRLLWILVAGALLSALAAMGWLHWTGRM